MDGERRTRAVTIDPAAMEAGPEALAELIVAALNEAWTGANAAKAGALQGLISGADGLR
jgi:DNA-binding protein YbaB